MPDDIFHISGAVILVIFPSGTDVSLDKPFAAIILDSFSDDISGFRISHPAVKDVDSFRGCIVDQFNSLFFRMALQPFSAEADFTYFLIL